MRISQDSLQKRYMRKVLGNSHLTSCLLLIAITGCATRHRPYPVWYQDGKAFRDITRDMADCKAKAALIQNTIVPFNAALLIAGAAAQSANRREYIENCMVAKGYLTVTSTSLAPHSLTNSIRK